jgi:transcriptional regulator with PAS, ATPase and Fis domain
MILVKHDETKHLILDQSDPRKHSFEDLVKENIVLRKMMDTFESGICYVNPDLQISYNNKAQLKMHNLEEDTTLGELVDEIYPGTGHIETQKTKSRRRKDELEFFKSGITVRTKYLPLWDCDGDFIGSVGISRKLEDYRDISIEIKSSGTIYNQFSVVFDHLQEAIVAIDIVGKVIYANNAYAQIVGQDIDVILGNKIKINTLGEIALSTLSQAKRLHENQLNVNDIGFDVISLPIITDETILGCVCILKDSTTMNLLTERLERTIQIAEYYRKKINTQTTLPLPFKNIIGSNPVLINQLSIAAKAAVTNCRVMIRGNNGVGKEMVAHAIHAASTRATGPFIAINCAALPDNLLESELFGYDPGAFTGAQKTGKPGKFELANGGTLFLDEIGNMSLNMQSKLLRILQNMENERIGSTKVRKLDVRVISATNKNLEQMILDGEFREDLYYRMNVVIVTIPDLKQRKEDIPVLSDHFLKEFSHYRDEQVRISEEAMDLLLNYDWPGNVRELSNAIECSVVFAEDNVIQPYHLPSNLWMHEKKEDSIVIIGKTIPLDKLVGECEKQAILRALQENDNNKTKAMAALELSRRAFYYKLNKYGITSEKDAEEPEILEET